MPGMLKIDSNITELPISPGIDKPSIVITGSSAFLSDNGNFVLFKYYSDTKTWEGNGEVI